jgi:hypothetical protein
MEEEWEKLNRTLSANESYRGQHNDRLLFVLGRVESRPSSYRPFPVPSKGECEGYASVIFLND